ncbi:MAG: LLM class flavin-dependent oxidoreductase [Proteobacteria bacterium]|nr:LLM class flavin-dependent oxidoreductase [Pseudomonadota bacterium]
MRLGALLSLGNATSPQALADQARMYEAEGYSSLWTPQAIGRGFMLPDPFTTLAVAATVTGLEIGTAVLQVPLYHPADLAHRIFSLMQLAPGRLRLGVGAGSTDRDFSAYGRVYTDRFRDFRNSVNDLRTLLTTGRNDVCDLSPWPHLEPPEILLGSWGEGVRKAAADYDGWIASANYRSTDQVEAAIRTYRSAGGGRAIVSTIMVGPDRDAGELKALLGRFAQAGFDDAVVMRLPGGLAADKIRNMI